MAWVQRREGTNARVATRGPDGKIKYEVFTSVVSAEAYLRRMDPQGYVPPAKRASRRKTHCPQGHPLTGENLGTTTARDGYERRYCKACKAEKTLARYHVTGETQGPKERLCRPCKEVGTRTPATGRTNHRVDGKIVYYPVCDAHRRGLRPGA
jgi:hypothetical protein